MKLLKRFLCLMLMIPFALCFVACKEQNDNSDKDSNDDGDSSPEIVQLSTNEILKFAYESFDSYSKTEKEGTNCYSAKEGSNYVYESYGNYAHDAVKLLEELSKVENLPENVWLESDDFENATNGSAKKLSKFFVSSEDSDDIQNVEILMKFEIQGVDSTVKTKTFDTFSYDINYYPRVEAVQFDVLIEKSRNYEGYNETNSKSNLFVFQFRNGEIYTTSFTRNADIEYLELLNTINDSSIKDYKALKFYATNNLVGVEVNEFDDKQAYTYQTIQKEVQKWLKAFVTLNEKIDGGIVSTETKFEGFSFEMRLIVNGIKKPQF